MIKKYSYYYIYETIKNDDKNLKAFGEHIRKLRMRKSNSLNEIAFTRGGVTSATLSRIENGLVDFKFSTLLKLSHTLDISIQELFKDFVYSDISED